MATHSSGTRIALLGLFGIKNYGNDGSLTAMLRHLRRANPDWELSAICSSPQGVAADHHIPGVSISTHYPPRPRNFLLKIASRLFLRIPREIALWARTIAYLRRIDRLVIPGTGVLDDFGCPPLGLPYDLFRWCVAARLCGTSVSFVSVGAGPIEHPLSRWFMKVAAQAASYRSYRDHVSRDFMTSLGVDTRADSVYPDIAFSLPAPSALRMRPRLGRPRVIGVGVMTYYGWHGDPERGATTFQEYLEKITRFVIWLLDEGYDVRLIVGDHSDSSAAAHVVREATSMRQLDGDRLTASTIDSMDDVLTELAGTDIVVSTRFHNIIGALLLDKPVISLSYASKSDVLLADMGLGKFCQHVERFTVATLIEHFCEVRDDWRRFERGIRERKKVYQLELAAQFARLFPAPTACRDKGGEVYTTALRERPSRARA